MQGLVWAQHKLPVLPDVQRRAFSNSSAIVKSVLSGRGFQVVSWAGLSKVVEQLAQPSARVGEQQALFALSGWLYKLWGGAGVAPVRTPAEVAALLAGMEPVLRFVRFGCLSPLLCAQCLHAPSTVMQGEGAWLGVPVCYAPALPRAHGCSPRRVSADWLHVGEDVEPPPALHVSGRCIALWRVREHNGLLCLTRAV